MLCLCILFTGLQTNNHAPNSELTKWIDVLSSVAHCVSTRTEPLQNEYFRNKRKWNGGLFVFVYSHWSLWDNAKKEGNQQKNYYVGRLKFIAVANECKHTELKLSELDSTSDACHKIELFERFYNFVALFLATLSHSRSPVIYTYTENYSCYCQCGSSLQLNSIQRIVFAFFTSYGVYGIFSKHFSHLTMNILTFHKIGLILVCHSFDLSVVYVSILFLFISHSLSLFTFLVIYLFFFQTVLENKLVSTVAILKYANC